MVLNYQPDEDMKINKCNVRIQHIQYRYKVILLSMYKALITTHLCSMDCYLTNIQEKCIWAGINAEKGC